MSATVPKTELPAPAAPVKRRDLSLDIFKGALVAMMVLAHTLQFFCDRDLHRDAKFLAAFVNLTTFAGFVFSFGYASELAYFRKPLKQVYSRMLAAAGKTYGAYVVSGMAHQFFLLDTPSLSGSLWKVMTFQAIPPYSEFLASFALVSFLGLLLFEPLRKLPDNKPLFWGIFCLLLLTTFLPQKSVHFNLLGILVGTDPQRHFNSFSVLQHMPFYLLGIYFCRFKIRFDWRILVAASLGTLFFFAMWKLRGDMPERFPISLPWLTGSWLFLYGYYLLSKTLDSPRIPTEILQTMGRSTLFYLLLSNLFYFAVSRALIDRYGEKFFALDTLQCVGLTLLLLAGIQFLSGIVVKSAPAPKPAEKGS